MFEPGPTQQWQLQGCSWQLDVDERFVLMSIGMLQITMPMAKLLVLQKAIAIMALLPNRCFFLAIEGFGFRSRDASLHNSGSHFGSPHHKDDSSLESMLSRLF